MALEGVNINNVSMDYFLRGIDAAKPQGAQSTQIPQDGANAQIDGRQEAARKMVSQLDVLLMKAAMASTKSLDGKQIKTSLKPLLDNGLIDKNSFKLLAQTADTAAKTLKALDKFTGKELASAIGADNKYDLTTKQGKAVAAAVEAQQNLADLLSQTGKMLSAMVRNEDKIRAQNPAFAGIDEKVLDDVYEFQQLCDRRATEIAGLTWQMKDFAVHLAANGENADPNVAAILKAKVNDLLPRQALAMHGTADALATVSESVSAKLRPLAEKIDAFRNNPSSAIGEAEFNALTHDIATMKAALQDIRKNGVEVAGRKNGVEVAGGRMMVAKDVITALEKEVAKAEELFTTARAEVSRRVLYNYIGTAVSLLSDNEARERQHCSGSTKHIAALECRNGFLNAMQELADAAVDSTKSQEDIQKLADDLGKLAENLEKAAKLAGDISAPSGASVNTVFTRLKNIKPLFFGFGTLVSSVLSGKRLFTGAEAMGVFKGTISASSVVEARARGLAARDVNPANEDTNIASERMLGAGAAGSVYELTRTDGTKVVFKGETESRTGLSSIAGGGGHSYASSQTTANLNIAAKNASVALGMGDLIVDYSVGMHNGVFGFYMEKAKGMTAHAMAEAGLFSSSSASDGGLSAKEIKKLPLEQRKQIKADIRRELNRLQWLDLVTGQVDRHNENYFIHVDRDTHKVTVKGIDNDAGYSQYRTGAVKFTLDKDRSGVFNYCLLDIAKKIDPHNVQGVVQDLLKDPGITSEGKGRHTVYTIDASKVKNKVLAKAICGVTGAQTLAVPDKIDSETYDALMALKSGEKREAYLKSIRPRLSEASYNAAVSRLDNVIAHAEQLKNDGKVIEKQNWLSEPDETIEKGDISVKKPNGDAKKLGGDIAKDANNGFCTSIFVRDGLNKIFD